LLILQITTEPVSDESPRPANPPYQNGVFFSSLDVHPPLPVDLLSILNHNWVVAIRMVASIRSESPIWQNQVDAARWTWVLPLLATSLSLLWILVQRYYRAGLSKFPGPALAAVSGFYKTYVEVFQQGCFVHKLEELHAKYGKIMLRSQSLFLAAH
jgi:hypothetical protein